MVGLRVEYDYIAVGFFHCYMKVLVNTTLYMPHYPALCLRRPASHLYSII